MLFFFFVCILCLGLLGEEPPPDWPQEGQIRMDRVSVRYAQNTDTVLRDISVNFKAGHKVWARETLDLYLTNRLSVVGAGVKCHIKAAIFAKGEVGGEGRRRAGT